jgi:TPR repeat protein
MKRLKLTVLLAGLVFSAFAIADLASTAIETELERELIPNSEYRNVTEAAFRAYQKGEYEDAFEYASKSARWGDKHAQFMLALMYVFGDGTDIDFVKGMAWLEVAGEAPNRKWRRDLAKLRQEATPEEIEAATAMAARLKDYYGMDANEITCSRRAEVGSNVKEAICVKRRRPDGISVRVPATFPM